MSDGTSGWTAAILLGAVLSGCAGSDERPADERAPESGAPEDPEEEDRPTMRELLEEWLDAIRGSDVRGPRLSTAPDE